MSYNDSNIIDAPEADMFDNADVTVKESPIVYFKQNVRPFENGELPPRIKVVYQDFYSRDFWLVIKRISKYKELLLCSRSDIDYAGDTWNNKKLNEKPFILGDSMNSKACAKMIDIVIERLPNNGLSIEGSLIPFGPKATEIVNFTDVSDYEITPCGFYSADLKHVDTLYGFNLVRKGDK